MLFILGALISLVLMCVNRRIGFLPTIKTLGAILVGLLLLWITIPSLKYVVTKDFDVVNGKCTIEISSYSRSSDSTFNMINTDEFFSFSEIPVLDAYGKSIPYYCEITVTKDHMWEIDYKIYDLETRKLIDSNIDD